MTSTHHTHKDSLGSSAHPMNAKHYFHLAVMTFLMFVAMYILMYAMVDRLENVFPNLNQFYMAALMTAPMVMIELVVMRSMYESRSTNITIAIASAILLAGSWIGIRQQIGINDGQFLKSMIPHHAGAVLMCENTSVSNAQIKSLCQEIARSQKAEIDQMKRMLAVLE